MGGILVDFIASPVPQCGFTNSLILFNAVVPGEDFSPFLSFLFLKKSSNMKFLFFFFNINLFLFHIYILSISSGTL